MVLYITEIHVIISHSLPEIVQQGSTGHANDDVCGCSFSANAIDNGTHSLVRVMVTPKCQIHLVSLSV